MQTESLDNWNKLCSYQKNKMRWGLYSHTTCSRQVKYVAVTKAAFLLFLSYEYCSCCWKFLSSTDIFLSHRNFLIVTFIFFVTGNLCIRRICLWLWQWISSYISKFIHLTEIWKYFLLVTQLFSCDSNVLTLVGIILL